MLPVWVWVPSGWVAVPPANCASLVHVLCTSCQATKVLCCYYACKAFIEAWLTRYIPQTRYPLNYSLLGARLSKLSSRSKRVFEIFLELLKQRHHNLGILRLRRQFKRRSATLNFFKTNIIWILDSNTNILQFLVGFISFYKKAIELIFQQSA